jgi:hypothetical protein
LGSGVFWVLLATIAIVLLLSAEYVCVRAVCYAIWLFAGVALITATSNGSAQTVDQIWRALHEHSFDWFERWYSHSDEILGMAYLTAAVLGLRACGFRFANRVAN